MKTIHIHNYIPWVNGNQFNNTDIPKLKQLIKDIYDQVLKVDSTFHFFFEPEIIIRIDEGATLVAVKQFLNNKQIEFEEYDYPFPTGGKFGETRGDVVAENLDLFLPVFHANSVAALKLGEEDHKKYLERLIHTAANPKFYPHEKEGQIIFDLARMKNPNLK